MSVTSQINAAEMEASIQRLADEIYQAYPDGNYVLVGIRSRGDEVAERIQALLSQKGSQVELGVLDISLYRDDLAHLKSNPKLQASELPFSLEGEHVIIVDDVLFTGRTMRAALDALMDYGRPAKVELAVLIDRGHREFPFLANYVGISLETKRMDYVEVKLKKTDGQDQVTVTKNANA